MAASADWASTNSDSAAYKASWARLGAAWASATAASLRSIAAQASITQGTESATAVRTAPAELGGSLAVNHLDYTESTQLAAPV